MPELSYVAEQVRRFDHDRYLTCLFASDERREDLLALYAFNIEIAKTREVVSEALLGEIRLQWWRDAVSACAVDQPPAHQIVRALADAIHRHALPQNELLGLIDARAADLRDEQPLDLAALERYVEESAVPLVRLALRVLGAWRPGLDAIARHAGIAYALTGLIRAIPFHARQKRIYLPRDLVRDLVPGTLFELKPSPALADAVKGVASLAGRHVECARRLAGEVPRAGLPALLTVTLAEAYLRRIAAAGGDPFDSRLVIGTPFRQLRLAWSAMRRKP